jgi:ribosome-binding protein aMBF1 (putative translation factor)
MEKQIEIKIIDGFWNMNDKKINDCNYLEKDFFGKYFILNIIKSPISEKSKPSFKNKREEVKKSFNYRFKNTDQMIDDFRSRIKDELAYLGMDYSELALKCYISSSRMMYLLTKKVNFLPNEISSIKKVLGM